jgi:nucleoid-associated protein YgaU
MACPTDGACTLLTTRDHRHDALGTAIDLDTLGETDAQLLTARRRPADAEDERAAREIARALGGHAQALDVAGAALRADAGLRSFARYRETLDAVDADELELAAALTDALPNGHERSIAATSRSVRRLDPPGADLLRLAAGLGSSPIPAALVAGIFGEADDLQADDARRRATAALDAVDARGPCARVPHGPVHRPGL